MEQATPTAPEITLPPEIEAELKAHRARGVQALEEQSEYLTQYPELNTEIERRIEGTPQDPIYSGIASVLAREFAHVQQGQGLVRLITGETRQTVTGVFAAAFTAGYRYAMKQEPVVTGEVVSADPE